MRKTTLYLIFGAGLLNFVCCIGAADVKADEEELSVPGETVQQAGEQAAEALRQSRMKISISTVGFDISRGSAAEQMLQEMAQIGGGQYYTAAASGQLTEALASAAKGQANVANSGEIVLTQPKEGDIAGPSIEVGGRADPSAVIIVFTDVFNAETGEKLRTVPGIRHRPSATGEFLFRIATPRISFGQTDKPPRLRYELHIYALQPNGTKSREIIVNLMSPP